MKTTPTLVVGGGPTGLSAAYHLGEGSLLVEREPRVGGLCRSIVQDGFTFDMAGHIMFSNDASVHALYAKLLGDNVHWQEREAWIYSHGVHTRYPFQGSLHGLPPRVIQECLIGAIEARQGNWRAAYERDQGPSSETTADAPAARCRNGGLESAIRSRLGAGDGARVDRRFEDCCADGILEPDVPLVRPPAAPRADEPRNFEEFIYRVWGAGIARHFAIPYNRKLWGVSLREMETSWLGGRVPLPDLEEMIEGALSPSSKPMGPNARFGYPLRGGFEALMRGFLPLLRGELVLGTELVALRPKERHALLSDGTQVAYESLVSTIPLPELIRRMGDHAPEEIHRDVNGLRRVSVRCVNLGVGRPRLTEKHWIYYPGDTVFHRIFVQGNASPHCNPEGGFGLTCEITYSDEKPLPWEGDDLVARCVTDARRVGILAPEDPVWTSCVTDIPYAYVVYDHERAERVRRVRAWLLAQGIVLGGRYSEWEYYNSDHAFLAGRSAAAQAVEARSTGAIRELSARGL